MASDSPQYDDPYGSNPDTYGGNQAYDPYADKKSQVSQWYQGYLGRQGSDAEINSWAQNPNFGNVQQWIGNSPEAQAYSKSQAQPASPAAASQPAQPAAYDPRKALSSVFAKYGLDPNNPGSGLGNIDYFLKRGGETGGGWTNPSNQSYWADRTGQEIEKALYGRVGGLIDTGSGQQQGSSSLTTGTDPQTAQMRSQLFSQLMQRANQGLAVDRNDPIIRSQADAYSANQDRSRRNYLADMAEQSGPITNLNSEKRLSAEQAGQSSGAFEAQLLGRELQSRRDEIQSALAQEGALLSNDQQLSLQRELGLLDNAIKQQQLGLQNKQLDLTSSLQNRALDQSGQQFLRTLGFNEADRGSYWDALRSGLVG